MHQGDLDSNAYNQLTGIRDRDGIFRRPGARCRRTFRAYIGVSIAFMRYCCRVPSCRLGISSRPAAARTRGHQQCILKLMPEKSSAARESERRTCEAGAFPWSWQNGVSSPARNEFANDVAA